MFRCIYIFFNDTATTEIYTYGHSLSLPVALPILARVGEGLDVAIALAREIDPALYAKRLDRNRVYAIGARALVEGPTPITHPEQLAGLTAVLHRDMPDNFAAWRRAAGVEDIEPDRKSTSLNSSH